MIDLSMIERGVRIMFYFALSNAQNMIKGHLKQPLFTYEAAMEWDYGPLLSLLDDLKTKKAVKV